MIVRRYLEWARTANASARAEAASALARAYLHSNLGPEDFRQAEAALTLLLDDASPLVRRALAEELASATEAPQHVLVALAHDQGDIAAIVLARSPLLAEADLIDCAAVGDALAQTAIALRPNLPETVAAALAEVAGPEALVTLARNRAARLPLYAFRRMVERFGDVPDLREALLARRDLPVETRQAIVVAVSKALGDFVTGCAWMRPERAARVVDEAREAATIAMEDAERDADHLVAHLRETGQLNAGLLLRALLSGREGLVVAALADLARMPQRRVAAIMAERRPHGFRALYAKAGLPPSLLPAYEAAIAAINEAGHDGSDARLSRRMIERVLTTLDRMPRAENDKLFALLRRFDAEAAREEARAFVEGLIEPVARESLPRPLPEARAA